MSFVHRYGLMTARAGMGYIFERLDAARQTDEANKSKPYAVKIKKVFHIGMC